MIVEIDMNTIVTVIIAGFTGHYIVMTLAIKTAVTSLGKKIAENYATKDDLERHLEHHHSG